jgi:DNA-binding response OmpR family regulator
MTSRAFEISLRSYSVEKDMRLCWLRVVGRAWNSFCQERPEVVVLDLKMSGIEGLTALQQVRRLNPDQRVIILTGAGTPEKEQEVRELGVTEYIEKKLLCILSVIL